MSYPATIAYDRPESPPLLSWPRATQLATGLLVAFVVARSMMLELTREPFEVSPGAQYTPLGTGVGSILVLNSLCLLPALLILLRRTFDRDYRPASGWVLFPLIALGLLATVSTHWAADKFPALVAGSTLICASLVAWSASQLIRSWARFRLVTATIVGILAVYAAQGIFYRAVELPELQRDVEMSKERILRERGFEENSFQANQFLKRITNGEMVGFGSSPNTYAAQIVMMSIIAAGLVAEGIRQKRDPVIVVPGAVALVVALVMSTYSHSNTARVTPVLAAGLFVLGVKGGPWLARHRRSAFVAALIIAALTVAAVVGHGIYHGGLPSASLNFRWRYWVSSYAMFQDHPFAGTGYANFGESYLRHRLPAAAEEIRDPHNLLVRFLTELGLPGLVLCLVWLAGSLWGATRPISLDLPPRRRGLAFGPLGFAAIIALAVALNIIATIDFFAGGGFVVIEMFKRHMFAGVLIVFGALTLIRSRTQNAANDEPAPWSLLACACALAIFLLHNIIDFSFFEPAAMMQFALVLGAVVAMRSGGALATPSTTSLHPAPLWTPPRIAAGAALVVMVIALTGFTAKATLPILAAEIRAHEADEYLRTARVGENEVRERYAAAVNAYLEASRLVPYNVDYLYRAGGALAVAKFDLPALRGTLDGAIVTDPLNLKSRLERARLELRLAADKFPEADLRMAEGQLAEAVRLNPTDASIRSDYAVALEALGRHADAARQLQIVLDYDNLLDPTEPKRLSPEARQTIASRILSLTARAGVTRGGPMPAPRPPATAPTPAP